MLGERKRELARTLLLEAVTSRHLSVFPSRCVRTYARQVGSIEAPPLSPLSILFHPVWLARRVTSNSHTANAIKSNPLVDLERAALIVAARSRLAARVAVGCSVVVVGAGESPAHTCTVRLVVGTCRPLGIVFHRAPRPQHRRETALGIGAGQ